MRWQIQEAKQRFSELVRRAQSDGPQAVTKHGREVAYVVDVSWYRERTGQSAELRQHLLQGPQEPRARETDGFAELVDGVRGHGLPRRHDPIAELVEELAVDTSDR